MRHGLLEDLELIDVRLSVDFVRHFEAAMHGARLLGTYRVHNCVRDTDGWALSMIEPFSEINQVGGVFFTEMADDDGIVAAYCSKRVGGMGNCPFGVSSTAVALQLAFGCDAASSRHGYRHLLVEVAKFEKEFFTCLLKIHSDLGSDWTTPLDAKLQGWLTMAGWEEVDTRPLAEYKVPSTQPGRSTEVVSSSTYRIFASGMRMDVHVKETDCSVFVNIKRSKDGVFCAPGRPWDV
ncbi:hypothetical protein AAVH_30897 [Aphelenchoides avenae]|nr:hypothetical protein AAVH_30897 [Aphelenchus avenae]